MNWKMKALAFHASAHMPGRRLLYRLVQQYVTKGHFLTITPTFLRLYGFHVANYQRVHPCRALEFGAGRNLLSPLLLSHAGATEIFVYDIERLSSAPQINDTVRQLRSCVPGDWPDVADCEDDLFRKYRIRYCAPGDARATGLPEGAIGFVCSTSVLEHIPAESIERILQECSRVSAPGALSSHIIDYTDHYRYADAAVPLFNFYRFSERQWRLWNPGGHFQNRLRHGDFERLFERAGLRSVKIDPHRVAPEVLAPTPLAREFRSYAPSDLLTEAAYCLLTRP
jgi:hypothetical protein